MLESGLRPRRVGADTAATARTRRLWVEPYEPAVAREWDDFVRGSKNGTFLFERGYMDYHRDRLEDCSLVIRDERGRIAALLPASRDGAEVISHGGLTYGGFVSGPEMTTRRMLDVFAVSLEHLREDGVVRLVYKCVPHIYHSLPAEEDAYALFVYGAALIRRDVSAAVRTDTQARFSLRRREALRLAARAGLQVERSQRFDSFWRVLERNLLLRYGRPPVHNLAEIASLASAFPGNIQLLLCRAGSAVLAGCVVYATGAVCHVQYIAATARGRQQGATDYLLAEVIARFAATHRFVDFGICTERDGHHLNEGLIAFKEGFGAGAVNYDRYELQLTG